MSQNYYYPRDRHANPWPTLGGIFVLTIMIAGLLWGLGVFRLGSEAPAPHNPSVKEREVSARTDFKPEELERITVYENTSPSVVNVDTLAYTVNRLNWTEAQQRQGTGTGFFWDDAGRIVTNFHVVKDALAVTSASDVVIANNRKIMVTLSNGEAIEARLVGIAPESDLAVIQLTRLPAGGVKKITIGTSKDLKVGQTVYAIGSPFGQQSTMTNGIVSALHREIESPTNQPILDVIQTNAALNPGNSGGPLLDKDGRLIGVNTAITSPSGGSVGIGYAIPVDTVNEKVTDIIRNGRPALPYIGADFVLPEARVRQMGFAKGVMIYRVQPHSPAAEAGLQPGDVIVKAKDSDIGGIADFNRAMGRVKVGDALSLTILREGEPMKVQLKVEGI